MIFRSMGVQVVHNGDIGFQLRVMKIFEVQFDFNFLFYLLVFHFKIFFVLFCVMNKTQNFAVNHGPSILYVIPHHPFKSFF
jgi:hypothetical protein